MRAVTKLLRSTRLWGLVGTGVVLYFVVFGVLGNVNVSGVMPDTNEIARTIIQVWPKMPFFVQTEQTPQGQVVTYTVSTHLITPAEMRQMGMTNAAPSQPTKPK